MPAAVDTERSPASSTCRRVKESSGKKKQRQELYNGGRSFILDKTKIAFLLGRLGQAGLGCAAL